MAPDTERELLEKVNEIHGYIFGVQGRPGAMEQIAQDAKERDDLLDKHSERLDNLEKWRWYVAGGIAVLLFIISLKWGH
jgi:hypothetical protein